jgi:predicted phosphodiesterase
MIIKNKLLILALVLITLTACDEMFDYSPYAIDFSEENRNVNQKNIEKLLLHEPDDTITIAFTGDTHRFYDQTDEFVKKVNQNPAVDFVIHVGDIADFGLPKQYIWGNSYLLKLNFPYFVLVGNHDVVGNGLTAFTEMFGALNFSFIYDSLKFIFINTNGLEFKFNGEVPDVQWLDAQLRPNNDFSKAIVIFHVPPMNCDFDSTLEEAFQKSLAQNNNVLFSVHGHLHDYEIYKPYDDSITYVNVYGVENMKFNLIKIIKNKFDVKTVAF